MNYEVKAERTQVGRDDDKRFRLVVIESPFAGNIDKNLTYARRAMADCLRRGEAPFASHLLFTQPRVLDDTIPEERSKGMAAGFAWAAHAEASVVYVDLGISSGMLRGIADAVRHSRPIEYRSIGA